MANKPKVNSAAERELDKAEKHLDAFENQVKDLTQDNLNMAPKFEQEQQTKLSSKEIEKNNQTYLKPKVSLGCRAKFNEDYRSQYNYDKEYVNFIAENKEIIGESIDLWTKPYAGVPYEEWVVPVNKPVWGPRYLAEQIKRCTYHKLVMEDRVTETNSTTSMYGQMVAKNTVNRLDAHPVTQRSSVFMGSKSF